VGSGASGGPLAPIDDQRVPSWRWRHAVSRPSAVVPAAGATALRPVARGVPEGDHRRGSQGDADDQQAGADHEEEAAATNSKLLHALTSRPSQVLPVIVPPIGCAANECPLKMKAVTP
jgi:hypothetical protein